MAESELARARGLLAVEGAGDGSTLTLPMSSISMDASLFNEEDGIVEFATSLDADSNRKWSGMSSLESGALLNGDGAPCAV